MKTSSIIILAAGLILLVGISILKIANPPNLNPSTPQLNSIRTEIAQNKAYTNEELSSVTSQVEALKANLWTNDTFNFWMNNTGKGWMTQPLGPSPSSKSIRAVRYAFQRPTATSREWEEILEFIRQVEATNTINIQSLTISANPGYQGSRRFSKCILVATFFFAEQS